MKKKEWLIVLTVVVLYHVYFILNSSEYCIKLFTDMCVIAMLHMIDLLLIFAKIVLNFSQFQEYARHLFYV